VSQRKTIAAILAIAALLGGAAWWMAKPRPSAAGSAPTAALRAASAPNAVTAGKTVLASSEALHAPQASPEVRSDSLRGTGVDGAIHLGIDGRPRADRDLRRMFDYFLTRQGERTPQAIRDDLQRYLRDAMADDPIGQAQVLSWFDQYVKAGQAATALSRSGDLAKDAAQMRAFHRQTLGDVLAQSWYGVEDDYAEYTAKRLQIEHDSTLSPADRSARLAALEDSLDPGQRDNQHASTDFQLAVAQSKQFIDGGTDPGARHQERANLWGEEAAQRLDALDRADADWQQRLRSYAVSRAAILADTTLSAAARAGRLDGLLAGFSEPERRRVLALADAGLLPR
jgi:lipase chaperone LimK